jgi:osmotically-inducible protein OsmY
MGAAADLRADAASLAAASIASNTKGVAGVKNNLTWR